MEMEEGLRLKVGLRSKNQKDESSGVMRRS